MTINPVSVYDRLPDVKVLFQFNGVRQRPMYSGCRPVHLIKDDYLTSGLHCYDNETCVAADGNVTGTITFITPEAYPHCLRVGQKIKILDGPMKTIGYATVLEIYNPVLMCDE